MPSLFLRFLFFAKLPDIKTKGCGVISTKVNTISEFKTEKSAPLSVLSLFSGIGAFERALENLNIAYDLAGYCENDKYASKAYSLLHNVPESMNLGDITSVDETSLPLNLDLITYGFP